MSGVLGTLRLARRNAWRSRWRSLLVVVLIALPSAFGTLAAITTRTWSADAASITGAESMARGIFRATGGSNLLDDKLTDLVEPGALVRVRTGPIEGWAIDFHEADVTDHRLDGLYGMTEGRAPATNGEVALTPTFLGALGAKVGAIVEVPYLGEVQVVGEFENLRKLDSLDVLLPPGGIDRLTDTHQVYVHDTWLVFDDTPQSELDAIVPPDADGEFGLVDLTKPEQFGTVLSALGLLATGFLAATAFAVAVRRRIREVGQLGALGLSPRQLRSVFAAEGALLGLLGGLAGVAVAFLAAGALRPTVAAAWNRQVSSLFWAPSDLVGPVALATIAAAAAAFWPAKAAASTPVAIALAGRVPPTRSSRRVLPLSLAGIALTLVVFASAVDSDGPSDLVGILVFASAGLLAVCAATLGGLTLSGLAAAVRRGPMSLRLALGESRRNLHRASAATGATLVIVGGATLILIGTASDVLTFSEGSTLVDDPAVVMIEPGHVALDNAEITNRFNATSVLSRRMVNVHLDLDYRGWSAYKGRPDLSSPQAIDFLDLPADTFDGNAIVLVQDPLERWPAGLDRVEVDTGFPGELKWLPVRYVTVDEELDDLIPTAFMTTAAAETLGFTKAPSELDPRVVRTERPLTEAQLTVASEFLREQIPSGYGPVGIAQNLGSAPPSSTFHWVVVGVAAALALVVSFVTGKLIAVELDQDLASMVSVGAPPAIRPRLLGIQAFLHVGTGVALGLTLGTLLTIVIGGWTNEAGELWPQWLCLAAVPLLAGLVAFTTTRAATPAVSSRARA